MLGPVGKLLSDESKWTKGVFARNRKGAEVEPESRGAKCFCVLGAIRAVYEPYEGFIAKSKLREALGVWLNLDVSHWNDAPERTFDDVRRLLEATGI